MKKYNLGDNKIKYLKKIKLKIYNIIICIYTNFLLCILLTCLKLFQSLHRQSLKIKWEIISFKSEGNNNQKQYEQLVVITF